MDDRIEGLLDTLQDRVDEQSRIIEALEQRVTDLSNENNATYQYCVQIARAQNVIIDVLGFTLRMLNPQHIDNATLEDLRERLDKARIPTGGTQEQPQDETITVICGDAEPPQTPVSGVDIDNPRLSVRLFGCEMERVLRRNDHKGGWGECDAEFFVDKLEEEKAEVIIALADVVKNSNDETRQKLLDECVDLANIAMMVADNYGGLNYSVPQEAQDETSNNEQGSNDGAMGDGLDGSVGVDAQLEALRQSLYYECDINMNWDMVNKISETVRPILEQWAQKVVDVQGQLDACETASDYVIHEEHQRAEQAEAERDRWHNEMLDAIAVKNHDPDAPSALSMVLAERDALKAEVARLREVIANAPHRVHCKGKDEYPQLCDCWKREALESEGK